MTLIKIENDRSTLDNTTAVVIYPFNNRGRLFENNCIDYGEVCNVVYLRVIKRE